MATFSVSEAFGTGFRLIGRKPAAVLAWGLTYLALGVLPVVAVFAWGGPDFVQLMRHAASDAATGPGGAAALTTSGGFLQLQSKMLLFQPVMFLSRIVSSAVITGAILRAVLEPSDSRFAYLRLGAQELWLGLLFLVIGVLAAIVMIVLAIPVAAVAAAVALAFNAARLSATWTTVTVILAVLAFVGVVVWLGLRFSLAAPMTFAQREFRLFESWTLTRGHTAKLLGLALLLVAVMLAIMVVVDGLMLVLFAGVAGVSPFDHTAVQAMFAAPPATWIARLAPLVAVFAVVGAFVSAAVFAICAAPWAAVYRDLEGQMATPPAVVGGAGMPAEPA